MPKETILSWSLVIAAVTPIWIGGITLIALPDVANGFGWGLIIAGGIIVTLAFIPRRTKYPKRVPQDTQQNILRVEVQSCSVLDFWPQPDNWQSRMLGHMNTVEVQAKFSPEGEIKLHSLELHMGRYIFDARRLPVIVIDHEETYSISFEVASRVIKQIVGKSHTTYIRAIFNDRDCRSNEFQIGLVYEQ